MDNSIIIKNVDKFYGKKQALKDISLTIEQGMFGLLGRNGAGKTTLMKTLAALHSKQSGSITVCGTPIEDAKDIRAITGYLPQDFSMYPSMTVEESLEYLGLLSGMNGGLIKKRSDMLLKRVNLTEHRRKRVKALSGGMKRRLGIAQALLHDPRVLIVDEPRILWKGTVSQLISEAEGNVYTVTAQKKFLPQIKKEHIVTGMLVQSEYAVVRIVSDSTPDIQNVVPTEPNAEDAYMYCLHKNGCDVGGDD